MLSETLLADSLKAKGDMVVDMAKIGKIEKKVRLATGGQMVKGKLVGGYRLPKQVKSDLAKGNISLRKAKTGSGYAIKPTVKGKRVFRARIKKMG